YNRKEIKDLIAYLKLIYNPMDDVSLQRIINVPKRGIGLKTMENLNALATLQNQSLYEVIQKGKEGKFKKMIEEIRTQVDKISLTELVEFILEKSGMRKELESEKSIEAEVRLEN